MNWSSEDKTVGYVVALFATHDKTVKMVAGWVASARPENEILEIAVGMAKKAFPISKGFSNHDASVMPIRQSHLAKGE